MGKVWPWVIGVVVVVVAVVLVDPVLPYDADKVHVTLRDLEEPFVDILTQDDESQLILRITDSAKTVRWVRGTSIFSSASMGRILRIPTEMGCWMPRPIPSIAVRSDLPSKISTLGFS